MYAVIATGGKQERVSEGMTLNVELLGVDEGSTVTFDTVLVVDGTTFAARKVGVVVSTGWGQVKILGINGPAQTVTILHADVQMTLHVGQSVSK